jgi:hypothetical protein
MNAFDVDFNDYYQQNTVYLSAIKNIYAPQGRGYGQCTVILGNKSGKGEEKERENVKEKM